MAEGDQHRHDPLQDEDDADGEGQAGHHHPTLKRATAKLLNHPGPDHHKEGGDHQPGEAIPAAQLAGAGQIADPANNPSHQEANRHDYGDPGRGQHREDQGQHPQHQHQYPFKQGEGLEASPIGRKQT